MSGKMPCEECGVNPACVEIDNGYRDRWLCRRCVMALTDDAEMEEDDTLGFCEREWDAQEVKT